ncbi:MAG TPA: hypothetical protein DHM44_07460 [Flexistipes sinusarabici]|uniref:DUF5666 domain-containing protein n=1 Tax=Flexistipes sinusarabici TaxID=2352 RepID=A0A3D5QCV5_FLESI|nr:hypothetical protein [Flexistipes sinusarabici]
MKRLILLTTITLLFSTFIFAYDSGHRYVEGYVSSISSNKIKLDDNSYRLKEDTVYRLRYDEGNAIKEKKIEKNDVDIHDKVILKVIGNNVLELVVEEY